MALAVSGACGSEGPGKACAAVEQHDVNEVKRSPAAAALISAAESNELELVKLLVEAGAPINEVAAA